MASYFGGFFLTIKLNAVNFLALFQKLGKIAKTFLCLFNQNESFILALSPEGTRKKVSSWKTGFYYIAKKANVPIYSVALDFENKQIKVFNPFIITGNIDNDITHLRSLYKGVKGKIPEYS